MNKKALHSISYGLYIIGSRRDGKINAQIANTVIQVCSEPPTISVCINRGNLTHDYISDSRVFSVSVLSQDTPLSFVGNFGFKSGRESDKFSGVSYKSGETGAPVVLDHAISYLEAKVTSQMDTGSHTIFVGEVMAAEVVADGEPMTYAYYQQVKRGTTPKTAPSYVGEKSEGGVKMAKYKCSVCGYVYDPQRGDPESNIAPGTAFEDLPDDWTCPVCGAAKADFDKLAD
jgi:flavin reductase (DIM6/NTAB) family NADH-FMN oxidoreductase RutF/rubredoxin